MDNIYFLYGNNLDSIHERSTELTTNSFVQHFELNNLDDADLLSNTNINLSLFQKDTFVLFKLSHKFLHQLEKSQEDFFLKINNYSLKNQIIISLYVEKLDKITKTLIIGSNLFKALKDRAIIEEHAKLNFWQIDEIEKYTQNLANKYQLSFEPEALDAFVECHKDCINLIKSELNKLRIFSLPSKLITKNIIFDLYKSRLNIDELFNSLILQNDLQNKNILDKISDKDSMLYLIASLQNKIRQAFSILVFVKSGLNYDQISRLLNIHPYKLELEIKKIKNIEIKYVEKILNTLSELELKLKTGVLKDANFLDLLLISA